jgi:protein-S-isoprenylcysteine O-methyltransferase Ste14
MRLGMTTTHALRPPLRLLLRVPVPWVYILGYLCGVGLESLVPTRSVIEAVPGVGVVGAGLFLLGAALAAWGWLTFWRVRTTTVPGQVSSHMVTWGPYRFTRNPMYVGLAIAYVGEAGILRHLWPLAFLPLVLAHVNWVVIPVEEQKLREVFGDEYEQYRRRVRRWV